MRGKLRLPAFLTRAFWAERARPITLRFTDHRGEHTHRELKPDGFGTGSLGWALRERMQFKVGDATVWVQVNLTMTVCGSKGLPRDEPLPAAG